MSNEVLTLLVGIAVGSGIFAALMVIYPKLGTGQLLKQAAVESALKPLVFQAIIAAYKLSEENVDAGLQRLKGTDKKKIADSLYARLPDKIGNYDLSLVKIVITKERFRDLVQQYYDEFMVFYEQHHDQFQQEFEKWKQSQQPG